MTDMKYEISMIAEEIALKEHGEDVEFYDLPDDVQTEIWGRAEREWSDRMADKADCMRERFEIKRLEKVNNENCPVEHCWNCSEVETCDVVKT